MIPNGPNDERIATQPGCHERPQPVLQKNAASTKIQKTTGTEINATAGVRITHLLY